MTSRDANFMEHASTCAFAMQQEDTIADAASGNSPNCAMDSAFGNSELEELLGAITHKIFVTTIDCVVLYASRA